MIDSYVFAILPITRCERSTRPPTRDLLLLTSEFFPEAPETHYQGPALRSVWTCLGSESEKVEFFRH